MLGYRSASQSYFRLKSARDVVALEMLHTSVHSAIAIADTIQGAFTSFLFHGGFIKTQLYAICCCFFAIGEYNLI
jgi:hypothetical protein